MKRQHILKEELVDVLHGLHLLSLHLKTAIQQEVHAASHLVLGRTSLNGKEFPCCLFPLCYLFIIECRSSGFF